MFFECVVCSELHNNSFIPIVAFLRAFQFCVFVSVHVFDILGY